MMPGQDANDDNFDLLYIDDTVSVPVRIALIRRF